MFFFIFLLLFFLFFFYFFLFFCFQSWLHDEIRNCLSKELDFINESRNAERTSNNFKNEPSIHVPKVFWHLTSRNVLTMVFKNHQFEMEYLNNICLYSFCVIYIFVSFFIGIY
jgi:hypothetical protein